MNIKRLIKEFWVSILCAVIFCVGLEIFVCWAFEGKILTSTISFIWVGGIFCILDEMIELSPKATNFIKKYIDEGIELSCKTTNFIKKYI